jgi:hypothetical protein
MSWCCAYAGRTRGAVFVISAVTCCRLMDETVAGGMDYEKNYLKKKQ